MPDNSENGTTTADFEELFARLKAEIQPQNSALSDPTANVLSLVAAAMKRQDDLRNADDKWSERIRKVEEHCGAELAALREKLSNAESERIDARNLAEARRIDAVLAEMRAAVALASERATAQAAQLATQVATTATTMAAQTNARAEPLEKRLALVEQNQYQTGGRDIQRGEERGQSNINRAALIAAIAALIGWATTIILALRH